MESKITEVVKLMLDAQMTFPECQQMLSEHVLRGALERSNGNKCKVAKLLKLHRNTVERRMDQALLDAKFFRKPVERSRHWKRTMQWA